jgi:hypothetical protein
MRELKTLTLSEVLMSLDGGGTVEEVQEKIRAVAASVLDTGNTGQLTIKLSFTRNGGDGSKQLKVKDTVSVVMPKRPKPETLFFATEDGSLTRQNPDQFTLGELGAAR